MIILICTIAFTICKPVSGLYIDDLKGQLIKEHPHAYEMKFSVKGACNKDIREGTILLPKKACRPYKKRKN